MKNALAIEFSTRFTKQRQIAPLEIKIAFRETLELFLADPDHPHLRNHPLTKDYAGFRSIDVTEDWRALYRVKGKRIIFVAFGTHEQLYG